LLIKSGGGVYDSTKSVFIIIPCAKYQTDMNNMGLTTKVQFCKVPACIKEMQLAFLVEFKQPSSL
jgi:hypothetical protein